MLTTRGGWHDQAIVRQARVTIRDARDTGINGTHACAGRAAARSHQGGGRTVTAVAVSEGAHHGHLVGQLPQHREMAPESDSGEGGLHLAEHGPILRWRRHLRVERLDVGGTTLQIEHDHRLVPQDVVGLVLGGPSLQTKQVGQGETT